MRLIQSHKEMIPVTVRADFLRSGEIIPLGVTDEQGKTCIIDKIEKIAIKQVAKNIIQKHYFCNSKGTEFGLYFIENIWYK